ncbi:MAG: succinate dehydrogenase, cytochrome b556 subunit [Pseudomonadota bacterium]
MAEDTVNTRPTYAPISSMGEGRPPLSPHLQIWGWTVTMASSITQRATGVGLYGGSFLLVAWLAAGAIGDEPYGFVTGLLGSPLGLFVLFGFTWAQMFHMTKGIVHLIWDSGHLIGKQRALQVNWAVYGISVALTGLIWGVGIVVNG